ncbi:MAG TPA: isochorismatase family protein, partial [Rhizomicrobium sp.]|nr:isochorismatase family protein [Rhizomicrobium sp.]
MTATLKDWIAPGRTALLLIDMQRDFAFPEGAVGKSGKDMAAPQAAVEQAARLAEAARKAGV